MGRPPRTARRRFLVGIVAAIAGARFPPARAAGDATDIPPQPYFANVKRACVDKVWEVKSPFMRESERPTAVEAFDHARRTYDQIISECNVA